MEFFDVDKAITWGLVRNCETKVEIDGDVYYGWRSFNGKVVIPVFPEGIYVYEKGEYKTLI